MLIINWWVIWVMMIKRLLWTWEMMWCNYRAMHLMMILVFKEQWDWLLIIEYMNWVNSSYTLMLIESCEFCEFLTSSRASLKVIIMLGWNIYWVPLLMKNQRKMVLARNDKNAKRKMVLAKRNKKLKKHASG